MTRSVFAIVTALLLVTGTGSAALARAPGGDFFNERCTFAGQRSGQDVDCDC